MAESHRVPTYPLVALDFGVQSQDPLIQTEGNTTAYGTSSGNSLRVSMAYSRHLIGSYRSGQD